MNASGGDMRKAVTYLQSSFQLSGGSGSGRASSSSDNMWVPTKVTPEMVTDISGQVQSIPPYLHSLAALHGSTGLLHMHSRTYLFLWCVDSGECRRCSLDFYGQWHI